MKPKYHWGSLLWGYIHTVCIINHHEKTQTSVGFLTIEINRLINILKSIILPCGSCQTDFINELNEFSQHLIDNKDINFMTMFYWSVDFHNKINKKLNKKIISHHDAVYLWYDNKSINTSLI